MAGDGQLGDRLRERTCRGASALSVFLQPLRGASGERERAVIRHDIHLKALESARQVLRAYHSERRRQI